MANCLKPEAPTLHSSCSMTLFQSRLGYKFISTVSTLWTIVFSQYWIKVGLSLGTEYRPTVKDCWGKVVELCSSADEVQRIKSSHSIWTTLLTQSSDGFGANFCPLVRSWNQFLCMVWKTAPGHLFCGMSEWHWSLASEALVMPCDRK